MINQIKEKMLGWGLPENTASEKLDRYYQMLIEKNAVMNLTRITDPADVITLHFLDSMALLKMTDISGKRVIDVGSGAGFPGLPLKIAEPGCRITLADSTRKKVDFIQSVVNELELIGADCVHVRAEEASRLPQYREMFDIAVSRAVARLSVLCELCLPFVKVGGFFAAYKGPASGTEKPEAEAVIAALGGALRNDFEYVIPGTDISHRLVIIDKVSKTPDKYPRKFSKMG